jgi:hypothetical protein
MNHIEFLYTIDSDLIKSKYEHERQYKEAVITALFSTNFSWFFDEKIIRYLRTNPTRKTNQFMSIYTVGHPSEIALFDSDITKFLLKEIKKCADKYVDYEFDEIRIWYQDTVLTLL